MRETNTTPGFLDKERIVASGGFNRWLVPPAALAIHLCIGMAYGFSVFWKPLESALVGADGKPIASCGAGASTLGEKFAVTGRALTATDCNWTQFDLGWMYTLFFVVLGCAAALFGGWLERVGPRKAGLASTVCWCGGLLLAAVGVHVHQLWLMWLGSGVIGGIGLGLGYISPVSTLMKWFPDRRGMAAGLAIAGFGGGAMVGSPLATRLMGYFATPTDPGVALTFVVLAVGYAVFMTAGSLTYRIPPIGWQPVGHQGAATHVVEQAMIVRRHVHLRTAHKTPQFWLLWIVLCMNVSAGIGVIGAASPMLQETFGGALAGHPEIGFGALKANPDLMKSVVAAAAGFVGLLSLFNIAGRFVWASASDRFGRKATYLAFFALGVAAYLTAAHAASIKSLGLFVAAFCLIASMYGGGFATIPAFLADLFGTQFVGAIHGRLLTAWSTAGIIGPVIVNYLHDVRVQSAALPVDMIYGSIFLVLAGLLVIGLAATVFIRPVATERFMSERELSEIRRAAHEISSAATSRPTPPAMLETPPPAKGMRVALFVAWTAVGVPLLYGIIVTVGKAAALFR
jgi:MFS family permease